MESDFKKNRPKCNVCGSCVIYVKNCKGDPNLRELFCRRCGNKQKFIIKYEEDDLDEEIEEGLEEEEIKKEIVDDNLNNESLEED